jgi:hypothetical protein
MTEPRRRLRRRSTDNDNEITEFLHPFPTEPLLWDTHSLSEVVSTPQHALATIAHDDFDPIRDAKLVL